MNLTMTKNYKLNQTKYNNVIDGFSHNTKDENNKPVHLWSTGLNLKNLTIYNWDFVSETKEINNE